MLKLLVNKLVTFNIIYQIQIRLWEIWNTLVKCICCFWFSLWLAENCGGTADQGQVKSAPEGPHKLSVLHQLPEYLDNFFLVIYSSSWKLMQNGHLWLTNVLCVADVLTLGKTGYLLHFITKNNHIAVGSF